MELTNEFSVPIGIDPAWEVLTDLPRLATCLPGAALDEVEGDEHRGRVRVKVGPITAEYRGTASFRSIDRAGGRAVLVASGRDSRGQGNASVEITADISGNGTRTIVRLTTDLRVSGKVAQFGRGVLSEVSEKLLDQFAANLAEALDVDASIARSAAVPSVEVPLPVGPAPATEVDLLEVVGMPLLRRLAVPLIVVAMIALAAVVRRRRVSSPPATR